jgi:hypothetical protein
LHFSVNSSVQAVGGVDEPGIDVLAHSSQYQAEEPTVTASGARLKVEDGLLPSSLSLAIAHPGIF